MRRDRWSVDAPSGGKKLRASARARETIHICILLFYIKSWNKNSHTTALRRIDLVRVATQKPIDMYSYRILYQKDVPNQITNFNAEETNKPESEMRHQAPSSGQTDRARACVRAWRVRHIFTYIKPKREKIAAAAVAADAATSSRNNKRQNDRLYFVSVFALLFSTCCDLSTLLPTFTCIGSSPRTNKRKTRNEPKKTRTLLHIESCGERAREQTHEII